MVKILVVDDQEGYLSLFRDFFVEHNYKVATATNVDEGLKEYVEERPKVIICDILMPGRKGYDFIKEVRRNNKKVLIIVVSVLQEFYSIEEAYTSGADFYLSKPVHFKTLHKCIKIMLNAK